MKKHANISVFVPHLGCPQQCSFCNQRYIAKTEKQPDACDVENAVKIAVNSKNFIPENTEIAFFGGSFTAIDREYMVRLLKTAYKYKLNNTVNGIRISTRPDKISTEILEILKKYGVTAIELGAQSMDDTVLKLNRRGHTAQDVEKASSLIKSFGFELGLQMMTGLLGDTDEKAIKTAKSIIALNPDTVRIYPTVVLENTHLGELYKNGEYFPQTLNSAVELTAKLLLMFYENNISVIRTGLHTIDETKYLAGPWHPAFRELCEAKIYLNKMLGKISEKGDYIIHIGKGCISKAIGQKKENIRILSELGFNCKIVESEYLNEFEIEIERVVEKV